MKLLLVITSLLLSISAWAEVSVIVHPSNANALEDSQISRIFLGKMKSYPDGSPAVPINQDEGSAVTAEFNDKTLKKSPSQLKAYWSKLVFTGKGAPPKNVANDSEMIALISANPNMIGFVDSTAVDGSVKVIQKY